MSENFICGRDDILKLANCFENALSIDNTTKWAWIGLGACHMFEGNLQKALQTWKQGLDIVHFAGPTLYAYRGECHRLMGNKTKALEDIRYAITQKPSRLSSHINLAFLESDTNPERAIEFVEKTKKENSSFSIMIFKSNRFFPE